MRSTIQGHSESASGAGRSSKGSRCASDGGEEVDNLVDQLFVLTNDDGSSARFHQTTSETTIVLVVGSTVRNEHVRAE
jgi:hypothetical protein